MIQEFRGKQRVFVFLLSAVFTSIGILMGPHVTLAAVGITPVEIDVKDILPRSSIEKTFFLSRENPFADEYADVTVSGTVAGYIKIPNNGKILLPKGVYNTPLKFRIEPGSLGEGEYTATLNAIPAAAPNARGQEGSGMSLIAGAQGRIRFSVSTNEIENLSISTPIIRNSEEGQILAIGYQLNNLGNVDARPTNIEVSFTDVADPKNTYTENIAGRELPIVKAFSSLSQDISTRASLSIGTYTGKVVFSMAHNPPVEFSSLRFQIFPKGTLAQKGELSTFTANKAQYFPGETVQFSATFLNTGKIGVLATLGIEIYQKEKRLDVLSTDSIFVPLGSQNSFHKEYSPPAPGSYEARGTVVYGVNKTEEVRIPFEVKTPVTTTPYILLALVLLTIVLAFILWLLVRRRRQTPADLNSPQKK